jgi:predicted restriction endonuclease
MEKTQTCKLCGKEFTYKKYAGKERIYCSQSCARRANANKHNRNKPDRMSNYSHKGYLSKTIIIRYSGRCAICGWRATEELITVKGRAQYAYGNEIHHIIAVEDGGQATEDNLILLCPNHHKQANLGLLSIEELKRHIKQPPTESEKQTMKNASTERIASAIFF